MLLGNFQAAVSEPAQYPTPLAEAIAESGYRQQWIAEQIEVTESTLSRWVTGNSQYPPNRENQVKLALLLRRKREDLFPSAAAA